MHWHRCCHQKKYVKNKRFQILNIEQLACHSLFIPLIFRWLRISEGDAKNYNENIEKTLTMTADKYVFQLSVQPMHFIFVRVEVYECKGHIEVY